MSEILLMAIEKGDIFTADTAVTYEALDDPKRGDDEDEELEISVRRVAGPDTVTGIKHTEPGADWTDVQYDTAPIPATSTFRGPWDEPVTLIRRSC